MSGQEQNKTNLVYFECSSMRALYDAMRNWQDTNHKDFLSLSIQQDNGNFCCIALTHPFDLVQQTQELLYEQEMARYQRKALKHIGVGVNFESDIIPHEKLLAIRTRLKICTTPTEVKAVFDEEF